MRHDDGQRQSVLKFRDFSSLDESYRKPILLKRKEYKRAKKGNMPSQNEEKIRRSVLIVLQTFLIISDYSALAYRLSSTTSWLENFTIGDVIALAVMVFGLS